MLKEIFEAVYIDPASKQVVGVKPYAEFVPLFQQTNMIEDDYRFVLEKEATAQNGCSSERSYVSSGSDGIGFSQRNMLPIATDSLYDDLFILVKARQKQG